MEAILKFNIDEPDQRKEHLRCVHSLDMALALWELQYNLKRKLEAEFGKTQMDESSQFVAREIAAGIVYDIISEMPISIDELVD